MSDILKEQGIDPDILAHGEEFIDGIISHHGVKGMKWGVRRAAKSIRGGSNAKPPPQHGKHDNRFPKPKPKMSEEELKAAVSRMELEKKYHDLSHQTTSTGKKFVHDIIKRVGKESSNLLIKTAVKTLIGPSIDKLLPSPKK